MPILWEENPEFSLQPWGLCFVTSLLTLWGHLSWDCVVYLSLQSFLRLQIHGSSEKGWAVSGTFQAPYGDFQGSQFPIWKMGPDSQFSPALSCLVAFNLILSSLRLLKGPQADYMHVGGHCHFNCTTLRSPFESRMLKDGGAEVPIVAASACPASPAWQLPCRSWQHGCLPPPLRAGRNH